MAQKLDEMEMQILELMQDLRENGREGFLIHQQPLPLGSQPPDHRPVISSEGWQEQLTPRMDDMQGEYGDTWAEGRRGKAAPIKMTDIDELFYPRSSRNEDLKNEAVRIFLDRPLKMLLSLEMEKPVETGVDRLEQLEMLIETDSAEALPCRCLIPPNVIVSAPYDYLIYWTPDGRVIDTRPPYEARKGSAAGQGLLSLTPKSDVLFPRPHQAPNSSRHDWSEITGLFKEFLQARKTYLKPKDAIDAFFRDRRYKDHPLIAALSLAESDLFYETTRKKYSHLWKETR